MDFYENEKKHMTVFAFFNPVIGNFQEILIFQLQENGKKKPRMNTKFHECLLQVTF